MPFIPIRYAEFYDVRRVFVAEHDGSVYVFDCPFDEDADDYRPSYTVHRVRAATLANTVSMSWSALVALGEPVGQCKVSEVRFDPTRRAGIDPSVLDRGLTSA